MFNLPTIIISLVLVAIVAAIIVNGVRARKKGKSCGCGCSGCAYKDSCHGGK